ncbi:MAG: DUF2306 domain-containing protein [Polyangiales bacterium]
MTNGTKGRRRLGTWAKGLLLAGLGLGAAGIVAMSVSYVELGREHPFFLEKQPLAHPDRWWVALVVHVPSALFSLPACLLLLVNAVRLRFPRFHRWLGRVTGVVILGAVVPSGMYLAWFATGGMAGTLGFWLTGVITFTSMVQSVRHARRRDYRAHRRHGLHVAGQLSVAVVSRVLLVGAEEVGLYDEWVYVAALWLPVLGSVVAVEAICGRLHRFVSRKGTHHEQMATLARLDPVR